MLPTAATHNGVSPEDAVTQGQLQPISEKASPEAKALAEGLRDIFSGLNLSVRRYATRCHCDPGTLSRYLNGSRVPPWSFVRQLITDVGSAKQRSVQAEVFEHVRTLHRDALQTSNADLYAVQVLQDQLEEADREQQRAALREQAILEALQLRQQRVADLETARLELEISVDTERAQRQELTRQLEAEREAGPQEMRRLKEEIAALKEQLNAAHTAKVTLENRCFELERQLDSVEVSAGAGQEAREAEALEEALREAAEAKSQLNIVKETMEAQARNLQERTEQNRRRTREREEKEEERQKKIKQMTPEALCREILQLELVASANSYGLQFAAARIYPLELIPELLSRMSISNRRITTQLAMEISDQRSPDEIHYLIKNHGGLSLGRRDSLASELIKWYSWERTGTDFLDLLRLLRAADEPALADEMITGAGVNQNPDKLVSMFSILEGDDLTALFSSIGSYRHWEKFPSLLLRLRTQPEVASALLQRFCSTRPREEADKLFAILMEHDMSEEASIVRDRLAGSE
jgi:hypothetical protein